MESHNESNGVRYQRRFRQNPMKPWHAWGDCIKADADLSAQTMGAWDGEYEARVVPPPEQTTKGNDITSKNPPSTCEARCDFF